MHNDQIFNHMKLALIAIFGIVSPFIVDAITAINPVVQFVSQIVICVLTVRYILIKTKNHQKWKRE